MPPQNTLIVARLRGGVKPTPSPLCLCNMRLLPVSKLTFSSQATGVVHATYVVVFANAHCLIANAHRLGVAHVHNAARFGHATCMTSLARAQRNGCARFCKFILQLCRRQASSLLLRNEHTQRPMHATLRSSLLTAIVMAICFC